MCLPSFTTILGLRFQFMSLSTTFPIKLGIRSKQEKHVHQLRQMDQERDKEKVEEGEREREVMSG